MSGFCLWSGQIRCRLYRHKIFLIMRRESAVNCSAGKKCNLKLAQNLRTQAISLPWSLKVWTSYAIIRWFCMIMITNDSRTPLLVVRSLSMYMNPQSKAPSLPISAVNDCSTAHLSVVISYRGLRCRKQQLKFFKLHLATIWQPLLISKVPGALSSCFVFSCQCAHDEKRWLGILCN